MTKDEQTCALVLLINPSVRRPRITQQYLGSIYLPVAVGYMGFSALDFRKPNEINEGRLPYLFMSAL
jgi:hypothetical protein